jgi:prevent-host-death family protein
MTRKQSARAGTSSQSPRGQWRLQDAKARFSELVRLAHSEGPQRVTLHGRDAVVVVDAEEFLRLKGGRTGQLLIDALQASPHRDIEIEPRRSATPVRDVRLRAVGCSTPTLFPSSAGPVPKHVSSRSSRLNPWSSSSSAR